MTQRSQLPAEATSGAIGASMPQDRPQQVDDASDIVEIARTVGRTVLGPNAQDTDTGPGPNAVNFRALAEAGLMGLAIPREFGGLDASGDTQRDVTETLASYCGVTTFTQAQHHGPARMIANGPNDALKKRLLPDMAAGRLLSGISFAHLRRPGPPVLRAHAVKGGYRMTGKAPWVTGWGLFHQVVYGASLPEGRFVNLWAPVNRDDFPELFDDLGPEDGRWGTMYASEPLPLCAMNASATVELTFENWFVPEEHCLSQSDRETMRRNDRNGVLGATAMPLGCTAAGIRLLCETAERRGLPAVERTAGSFRSEWEDVRAEAEAWSKRGSEPDFFPRAVAIRAWCIDLAMRAAHAAVTASSGAANLQSHPAQRLLREAMFYTVQAQTTDVMDATLARLESNGRK